MRITMVGAGYVGLVSGACFADFGHHVICIDNDAKKVDALNRGEIPIYEPGLAELVAGNVKQRRLSFSDDIAAGVRGADVVFIAVGTPSRRGDGHADLSYVYAAACEVAGALSDFTVIVTKSTVPVGSGDMVENTLRQASRARGQDMNYRDANATRGKAVRAEPCVAAYEQGRVHQYPQWIQKILPLLKVLV